MGVVVIVQITILRLVDIGLGVLDILKIFQYDLDPYDLDV